jgi:hypothetical protein
MRLMQHAHLPWYDAIYGDTGKTSGTPESYGIESRVAGFEPQQSWDPMA